MELLRNPVFLLLAVSLSGYLLGRIRIGTFSFGSSAVVFSGLAFGFAGYALPGALQTLGLALFIYSVGQQAGPGFLHSMKHGGLTLSLGAIGMVCTALVAVLGFKFWLGFSREVTAGLFAGSMTSTPALAVAVEMAHDSEAPAAYGVAYLFGAVGVVLAVKLLPWLLRVTIRREEEKLEQEMMNLHPQMNFVHLLVTNPNLCTDPVCSVLPDRMAGVTITRVLRQTASAPILCTAETVLHQNDIVRVVGTDEALQQAEVIIGPKIEADLDFNSDLINRKILLSRPDISGKTLRALNLSHVYGVQVSRITRNGFDCSPGANLRLSQGDIVHVVGHPEAIENVRKLLGDNVRALYTVNAMMLLFGLFCGFLLGAIPLYLPGLGIFTLGSTGGVLLAGLMLSALRQIGPMVTELPDATNIFIRDLGLALFLAVVGTTAGGSMLPTLAKYGFPLFLAGVGVTLTALTTGIILSIFALRIPFLRSLGVITGGMTSTPGLDAAASLSPTSYAATAYATVYPAALIAKIIATKIIMLLG